MRAPRSRIPPRPERSWLCRGPERGDRISLGGRSITIGCRHWRPIWFSRQVTVIARSAALPAALAAKAATTTIPIVFWTGADPVAARTCRQPEPTGRQRDGRDHFERGARAEAAGTAARADARRRPSLRCSSTRPTPVCRDLSRETCRRRRVSLGLQLHVLHASTERDFDTAFATLSQLRAGGLVIGTDDSSLARANSSPHWRSATRCPRSSNIASSSRLAA